MQQNRKRKKLWGPQIWMIFGPRARSSSFGVLRVESHDFSQADKERTACKAEQTHKMTTIFTQKDNLGPF